MNIQQAIVSGIRELLFQHDYLVVPHFGGFVLKSAPTHFSGPAFLVPPSKTITFNAQLRQSDGILAAWLQQHLQCTAAESQNHLKEFAEYCRSVLAAKRRMTLEDIGFFYLDFENNLCFEPQPDLNFLADSFGLAGISLKEIEPEQVEVKRVDVFVDRKPERTIVAEPVKSKKRFNYLPLVSSLAVLALVGMLVLFISNKRISGQLRASVLGEYTGMKYQPVDYPELILLQPEQKNEAYVADANGIAVLELGKSTIAVKAIEGTLVAASNERSKVNLVTSENKFSVVLGCFSVLENAERMVRDLSREHVTAVISEKNAKGLYTVSNGDFASKEDAIARLQTLKPSFPKAWIRHP